MLRILAIGLFAMAGTAAKAQESYVPEKRLVVSRDVDFYGSDLQNLFDTTYEACAQTCLSRPECVAFTFNQRSNACFPKSEVNERQPYDGAVSAEVFSASDTILKTARARGKDLGFLSENDLTRAKDLAANIGRRHAGGPWAVADMLQAAKERRAEGNMLSAMRWTGGALSKADRSDLWLEYGRLNAGLRGDRTSETRRYQEQAYLASINAYLRATSDAEQVNALVLMAERLEDQDRGKAVLRSLRLAETINPRSEILEKLEDAIGKYGFRVSDHQVESDLEAPRLCAEFNEALIEAGQDYTPYVKLPDARLALRVEERRICVEGLAHGQDIQVTFREGLPAKSGESLVRDTDVRAYVRDRSPRVAFAGRAYVLPRSSDAGIPIETVNLNEVSLTLQRVNDRNILRAMQDGYFGQPLSYWQMEDFDRDVAETVWTGTGQVENTLNQTMTTRLPMADLVAGQAAGVYALTADVPGADKYDETSATQWFLLSDIGISSLSGSDGLHVFVRQLSDAGALSGATVTLLSRANRILAEEVADNEGYAVFDAGLTRGAGSASPALLMVQKGDDFSFLSLTDPAFDLSDRGVEGRPATPPIDVYVTTDRGAYRVGETIYVTALARGDRAQALPALPLTAILTRPDGVEYSRRISVDGVAGGHVFELPLGATVPRGRWSLALKSDLEAPALATAKVLVEDFLPERIDFDLTPPDGAFDVQNPSPLALSARYLFGAPAANLDVEGQVTLKARDTLEEYPGFRFGRYDLPFYGQTEYFSGDVTDSKGQADIFVPLPEQEAKGRALIAEVAVRVLEGSGRPVERRIGHPVAATTPMVGIKPRFGEDVVPEGSQASFELLALDADLTPAAMPVNWAVNRLRTHYQWYQLNGGWEWEPTTTREVVASGSVTLDGAPLEVSADVDWGRYEIVVTQDGGDYVSTAITFDAGWYAPVDATETPDTLELSLDAKRYRSGEAAQLRLVPRYAGTALISVMSNRLIAMKTVEVQEGENLIDLDVTDEWGAGAYVTASVIRAGNAPAGQNPARALGLQYAQVDPEEKQLAVTIAAPDVMDPRGPLDVALQVDGVKPGETAYVTLAAVDVGILNLTSFESPDPSGHYFGQRRLGMEVRDVYGRLINGLSGAMGRLRSGGDANAAGDFDSPPPTEELVAYFSGVVTVGEDGAANVQFDIPEFNGSVRLMAVAWSQTGVGQAEAEVLVRDPVVVTASLPRFLAPGDQSRLLLEFVHAEGAAGRMGLDVEAASVALDAAAIPSGFDLAAQGTQSFSIPLTALETGDHAVRVSLTTPDGKTLVKSLTLPVRANDPAVSETRQLTLAAGETLSLGEDLFADLRVGSAEAVVSSGALSRFDAPGLLQALDRYPYGCTEQVTSQTLPLLYFEDVASGLGLGVDQDIDARVAEAISLVLTRQASNGSFGLWRPESGDFWLDAYVTDFLSRARAQGHAVPDPAFKQAMNNLRNRVNYAPDFDSGGEDLAYALMVLAREGAAAMGDLRYYADVKGTAFATPLAAAQLGAALALYGDQMRADEMFRTAARKIEAQEGREETPLWRVDYGTDLRDAAGAVALAVAAGSEAIDIDGLLHQVAADRPERSTQEAVWSLMAAHALTEDERPNGLILNGKALNGPLLQRLKDQDVSQEVALTNAGDVPQVVTVTTVGVPTYPTEARSYGYRLERAYFSLEGQPVELETVRAGERFVTVLTVAPASDGGARLMVNDPLPAGFEIDNPNLLAAGDLRDMDWLQPVEAANTEFRADRFLAAVDWRSAEPFQLAYMVRAVSPGSYHHPAASVEDMYRPQYRANTAASRLVVTE
ncbi:alpha-2-macroglobulin family protein [Shimia sp. MMG029]|uniref:alpha-2-macroglobulin family protein n=1 Tax=Shimia sp. MMG029 TaxID=3021978 RepID=UPI0022FE470E|nr:alpha-2-macroglobulin family protein [Shimia sp. MMG029]MDA5556801.1 alpha-2-macroglobulin family protein [Shimia sp. MMG029]